MPVELCDGLAAREAAQVPDAERAVVSAAYHEVVDEAGEEGGGGGGVGGGGGRDEAMRACMLFIRGEREFLEGAFLV